MTHNNNSVQPNQYIHPKQWLTAGIHLAGWVMLFAIFLWMDDQSLPGTGLLLAFGIFLFYLNYFFLTPVYILHKKHGAFLAAVLIIAFLFSVIASLPIHKISVQSSAIQHFRETILLMTAVISFSSLIRVLRQSRDTEHQDQQLKSKEQEAELTNLRQQVNPHFLFNALNNIHSLAHRKSDQTSEAIARLSSILRYMLRENPRQEIPLSHEIALIEDYISLQKLWTKNSVSVNFVAENISEEHCIEPFILNPLVENAFKHGSAAGEKSVISIHLRMETNWLNVLINNPVFPDNSEKKESMGIGMNNVIRRLELCYPGNYRLESARKGKQYELNLSMKLRTNELHCN